MVYYLKWEIWVFGFFYYRFNTYNKSLIIQNHGPKNQNCGNMKC